MSQAFKPSKPDYNLSPYTGMTRDSWIEAGRHLLTGIFQHIEHFEDPVVMPRTETDITYPHKDSPPEWYEVERRAEMFEGLTRSLFIAAPLLKNDPDLSLCGYRIADYYKMQILRACTSEASLNAAASMHSGNSRGSLEASTPSSSSLRPESSMSCDCSTSPEASTPSGSSLRPDASTISCCASNSKSPCKSDFSLSIGTYEELQEITHHQDPFRPFQPTVETCALVIGLWVCRDVIWTKYTKDEQDVIAAFLSSYAHANTVPQNWRLFNMLDLAFLHMNGYPIDEEIMMEHAARILEYYAGDGWYRDGHCFDYYSCWAFQVYAPLWNLWYGYEHAPEIAQKFEEYSNCLMETYPDFFDEDGHVTMWGRSNVYRCAAASPFDANFYVKHPAVNPGLARRICSGSLLQFLGREDFYKNGLPSIGFYGQFAPLVQGYSCTESPFWLGKSFLCLDLPADHPFWTATEENGTWSLLRGNEVKTTTLNAPALSFTNHKANGSTLIRSGKIVKKNDDIHGMWNYGKLAFHSKYPWEATPSGEARKEDSFQPVAEKSIQRESKGEFMSESRDEPLLASIGESRDEPLLASMSTTSVSVSNCPVESQQYVLRDETDGNIEYTNVCFWHGEHDGVLYRRQFFDYTLDRECMWMQAISLADFPMPYGLMRADRIRLYRRPVTLTLGAFGFPDNGTEIIRKEEKQVDAQASSFSGFDKQTPSELPQKSKAWGRAIVLKGKDSLGNDKQLAMTIYDGWDSLDLMASRGTNPDSDHSIVVYAKCTKKKQYSGAESSLLISQVLTKESSEDFLPEELFPVKTIIYSDRYGSGGYGDVRILMKSGEEKRICFGGMEGALML